MKVCEHVSTYLKNGTDLFYLHEDEESGIIYLFGNDGCFYDSDITFTVVSRLDYIRFDKSLLTKEFYDGINDRYFDALGRKLKKKLYDFLKEDDITSLRAEMKMSQDKFADYFGISLELLQDWEIGRKNPSQKILIYMLHKLYLHRSIKND